MTVLRCILLLGVTMKIVIAEDDLTSSDFVKRGLTEQGHSVEAYSSGRDALAHCLYNTCDLIILDRMLPDLDGLSVLKALRSANIKAPVIFLTSMSNIEDRVEGLMAGGDDYLVKPFHFSELMARITALARRPVETKASTVLSVGDLEVDLMSRHVKRGTVIIELQPKEFALLEVLMRHEGRVVTRTMLLEQVWDFNFDPQTSVVETHMSRLRAKIDRPFDKPLIHTSRNIGYSLYAQK
jgi:two-component system, OmpR family, response regulator